VEKFYASRISQLISTVRSGCDVEIEEQLLFCEQWGGPLAAAAQVALAWVVERRGWKGAPGSSGQAAKQLELAPSEKKPPRPTPAWVRQALAERQR